MLSFAVGLLIAGGAAAQQIVGTSSINASDVPPMPSPAPSASSPAASSSVTSSPSASSVSSGSLSSSLGQSYGDSSSAGYGSSSGYGYSSSAGYDSSSGYGYSSSGYGTPSYGADSSVYTPPPSTYDQSYYNTFTGGGYSTMDCGYGYAKGSDNKCSVQSWVGILFNIPLYFFFMTLLVLNATMGMLSNRYSPRVRRRSISRCMRHNRTPRRQSSCYNNYNSYDQSTVTKTMTDTMTVTMTETMTSVSTYTATVTQTQTKYGLLFSRSIIILRHWFSGRLLIPRRLPRHSSLYVIYIVTVWHL